MEIIVAGEEHFPIIREIAHQTWPDTFRTILSPQQIDYMLEWMYSIDSLKKQVHEQKHVFLLVKDADKFQGFVSYETHYKGRSATKIHKIYILPESQGKSIGKKLMSRIGEEALKHGDSLITLNVNRHNKAAEVYKRLGFKIVQEENIPIGNGFFMNDFVMEKSLVRS